MNIQDEVQKIHHKFGITEKANYEIQKLFDKAIKETKETVVKSLPSDEEVKTHIDTLPYYGTCTTEYKEGFEDGVKWIKEQLAN